MRKFAVLAVLAIGLLVASLAFAQPGAGFTDYSSGFGYVPDRGISVGYEAMGESQAATGQFDFRRANGQDQGEGFHALVTCLNVDGNEAWMIIQVEQTNDTFSGHRAVYVQDNSDGKRNGSWDRFRIRNTDKPLAADCDRNDNDRDNSREIRGDIVVEEGGFARNP